MSSDGTTQYTYDTHGNKENVIYPNGLTTTYGYPSTLRPFDPSTLRPFDKLRTPQAQDTASSGHRKLRTPQAQDTASSGQALMPTG